MLEAYKKNLNNLNNKFFNIKDSSPNYGFNILKEFQISNYIKEIITIEKIQKELEIKIFDKNSINIVIF